MSRFNHSPDRPSAGAPQRIDVTGSNESCLRVDGGAAGATVLNLGPCAAQYADAVEPDTAYPDAAVLAVGDSYTVAIDDVCDFWAAGNGRAQLVVDHPDPAPVPAPEPDADEPQPEPEAASDDAPPASDAATDWEPAPADPPPAGDPDAEWNPETPPEADTQLEARTDDADTEKNG